MSPKRILSQELQLFLEVPTHITRGEQLLLEVSISNYLDQDNEVRQRQTVVQFSYILPEFRIKAFFKQFLAKGKNEIWM